MILFRSKPIRKPLLTLTGTKAEPSPRVYVSQKITNHNSLSQTIPTNCMYHIKWTLTSTSRSTDIHTNPDLSTYLTTDRVTLDGIGNLQKKDCDYLQVGFRASWHLPRFVFLGPGSPVCTEKSWTESNRC